MIKIVLVENGVLYDMNYAILVGAFAVFATVASAIENRNSSLKTRFFTKGVSILLFVVFFIRYLSYNSLLNGTTLNPNPHISDITYPGGSRGWAALAFFTEWLSIAVVLLLVLKPFFKLKILDALTLYFAPAYCVLAVISLNAFCKISVGAGDVTFATVAWAVEIALCIFVTLCNWLDVLKEKTLPKLQGREWAYFALCLVLAIIVAMPNFGLQFLMGPVARDSVEVKGIRFLHRVIMYGAIVTPICIYYALRNKDRSVIRCVLIYFSLVAMFIYLYHVTFSKLISDPTSWPLHLCNTVMFLTPICLIFKTNKLFYFTYFINVFGALMAMLMPNYADAQMLNSSGTIRFWYNHYCAFFMPLLLVALKEFERPTIKQFKYSVIGFCMYFVFVLLMNVILRGFGHNADYFFLAGDHIAGVLGTWARNIYNVTAGFTIAGHEFVFRPLYQSLFFVVYVLLGMAMWFVYELAFTLTEAHGALTERRRKIRLDKFALSAALNGRSIEEPMNENAGIKLELKHFSKKYSTSKTYAVNDANFEVHGGEIFGFLGPNGAGKSTIIKSIVGIQPITEGSIEVCGYDCEKQPVQAKRIIGYVPDHYALYEKLTGREYINYIADIYDVSQEDRTERIERHIKMFELEGSIDNPIKTYSHGMKQKITIMAALVHEPKLWILDEPLTGLDPNSIHQVKECMKEHAAKGNIVFFSSHIIDVVERICDRITIIKKGKILVTRNVADLEKEGVLLEEYYLKLINGESVEK